MAVLTIRNIDEDVKARLRVRAATYGRSMEEEARVIPRQAVGGADGATVWALSRQLFGGEGGVVLELPSRVGDRAEPSIPLATRNMRGFLVLEIEVDDTCYQTPTG
jgi:plasmid stability protein